MVDKIAQAKEDSSLIVLKDVERLLFSSKNNLINSLKDIDSFLGFLSQDQQYSKNNFALISNYRNKFKELASTIQSATKQLKSSQLVTIPPAPSPDFESATKHWTSLQQAIGKLITQISPILRSLNRGSDLLSQAISANKDWTSDWKPILELWKTILRLSWELQLTNTKYAATKVAYPAMEPIFSRTGKYDLAKWKSVASKMNSFSRIYGSNYTFPQILYHFTKDWDMFERFSFKKWYKWSTSMKKASINDRIQKFAYADTLGQDRLSQFTTKRKKLLNRISLVRKALHELMNSGLIDQQASNKIYKIISMLEMEAMQVQAPKIAMARVKRASKQFDSLGFIEGSNILNLAIADLQDNVALTKVANEESRGSQQEAVSLLRDLKKEMDLLNYGRHLDALYDIMKKLKKMGRSSDAEAVEKVIRDDLSSLEKLNKKLVDVYTSLSKVPLEMSEAEDITTEDPKSRPMNIQVKEEPSRPKQQEIEPAMPQAESPRQTVRERVRSRQQQLQAPKLDTAVPNV